MASIFEQKDRRVIPNWRSFGTTLNSGELEFSTLQTSEVKSKLLTIADYIEAWEENKSISTGGDLISAAFVNLFTKDPIVTEAAIYILSNQEKSTIVLNDLASKILYREQNAIINEVNFNLMNCFNINEQNKAIKLLKNRTKLFPLNPIFYVELSRLYSIQGIKEKAIRNMMIAIQLAPENRFILRCASRLFAHYGEIDRIYNIISTSEIVRNDPWITSAEISLSMVRKRTPLFVKKGMAMINSGNFHPHSITELASSLGTLELSNGSRNKAKKLFKKALISPNDNSLAQAKWVANRDYLFPVNPIEYDIQNKFEALALDSFYREQWDETLGHCYKWFYDLPFSKRPIMYGVYIAGSILDDNEKAKELLKLGLISHPTDPLLINNFAYILALENKLNESENILSRLNQNDEISESTKICLIATHGLVSFRKGELEKGRGLYYKAIDQAKALGKENIIWLAFLNYAREEVINKTEYIDSVINIVSKIPDNTEFPEINRLKKKVVELYHNYNE